MVLYGCETWPLTIRKEHRLKAFENRVLNEIFLANRHEEIEGWRKVHNDEHHDILFAKYI
jgi:hypothetical protein